MKYVYNDYVEVRDWIIDFLIDAQMKTGYNFDLVFMAGRLSNQRELEKINPEFDV